MCVALCGALWLITTELALPAMARGRIADELRALGFEAAAFRVQHVGLDRVVLSDLELGAGLSVERLEATLDLAAARVTAVELVGLRWTLDPSSLGTSALGRLVSAREPGAPASAAPTVRLRRCEIRIASERPWTLSVEGLLDPGEGEADLVLRGELGEHTLRVRVDETPEALVVHALGRSTTTSDAVEVQLVAPSDGPVQLVASGQLAEGERWPGVTVGEARVDARATIESGRLTELALEARSEGLRMDALTLESVAVDAAREGEHVAWSARGHTAGGLAGRLGGALPLELERWPAALGDAMDWQLEGPVPAEWLERRADGLALGGDVSVTLRGTARVEPSGAWTLGAIRGSAEVVELRVPSANTMLGAARLEVVARASVDDGVVTLELDDGSRLVAGRASLEEVHARALDARAPLTLSIDAHGVSMRARGPADVRTAVFAIGVGPSALQFRSVRFALSERAGQPLLDARGGQLRVRFAMAAVAPELRGVMRGTGVRARGTLEVSVGPDGSRIAMPLDVRAARLEQEDSEVSVDDARVRLPLAWTRGVLRMRGRMQARSLAWRGVPVGATEGEVRIASRALELAWTGPATQTSRFRMDATVRLDDSGRGWVDVEVPATEVQEGDPLKRVLAELTSLRIDGRVEGEVHVDLTRPERGRARLLLAGADLEEVAGAGRARDVRGTLRFARLDPLVGAGDAPLTWSELELGEVIRLGPGEAALRFVPVGDASEIDVTGMRAAAAGGHIALAPFRFDWEAPAVDLDVTVEGVELRRVVHALTDGRASASGHVDGRVAFRLELGERRRVLLGDGRLRARGPGRLQIGAGQLAPIDETQLDTLLQGEWVKRRVVAALADFEYRRLVLELDEVDGTRRLRAHVLGTGRRMPQELDLTLNVRGIQPLLDQALRVWPAGASDVVLSQESS